MPSSAARTAATRHSNPADATTAPQLLADRDSARRARWLGLGACAAVALGYAEFLRHALTLCSGTKGDFLAFYDAACAMVDGGDLYAERHRNYIYPPLVAMLYMPLSVLKQNTAGVVALVASVLMSVGSLWMLAREMCERLARRAGLCLVPLVMAIALVVVSDKVRSEMRMWQTNAMMLFLMALAMRRLDPRPGRAGFLLGLAVNVKYLPIFFLPWLLVRRRFGAATGMVAGIAAGAFAPAIWVGWEKNIEYLRVGFGGLAALVGIDLGGPKAGLEGMTEDLSVSLTSAIARLMGGPGHEQAAMAAAGAAALLVCLWIAWQYWRAGVPLLAWPRASGQRIDLFRSLVAIEWCALIIGMLVFSPQTNTRHLYLLMAPAAAAGVIILSPARQTYRWVVLVGVVLLDAALLLPPGGTQRLNEAVRLWRNSGGLSFGMLAMLGCLVWAGVRTAMSGVPSVPGPLDRTSPVSVPASGSR